MRAIQLEFDHGKTLKRFWSKVAVKVGQVNETYEPCRSRFCEGCQSDGHCWRRWPCWNWRQNPNISGYGQFWINELQRCVGAHRVAWALATNEDLPSGFICHHCDNTICCNPKHLFKGSNKKNADDALDKGRLATGDRQGLRLHPERRAFGQRNGAYTHPETRARGERHGSKTKPERLKRGEAHHGSKLTSDDVRWIRWVGRDKRYTQQKLANIFSVSVSTINSIVLCRTWSHVK